MHIKLFQHITNLSAFYFNLLTYILSSKAILLGQFANGLPDLLRGEWNLPCTNTWTFLHKAWGIEFYICMSAIFPVSAWSCGYRLNLHFIAIIYIYIYKYIIFCVIKYYAYWVNIKTLINTHHIIYETT